MNSDQIQSILKRPTSAVYSSRMDIRTVASLTKYWISKGHKPTSVSELMRLSLETFSDLLYQNSCTEKFTAQDAYNFLESIGLLKTLSSRNRTSLVKQIQSEVLKSEGIDLSYLEPRKGQANISEDQVQRAKELLQQKQDDNLSGAIAGDCDLPKPVEEE